jgi:pimeloyl-ACP methyl ester carboxylesterase
MKVNNELAAAITRWLRRLAGGITLLVAVMAVALVVWARQLTAADPAASDALAGDEAVAVREDDWFIFEPRDVDPGVGIVFYPGGKADPVAYAPILSRIAAEGYLVVMTPMPLNLALLAPGRAGRVMARYPAIRQWIIAGHSLGGVLACAFASGHREQLAGLMLWAAYPAPFSDLGATALPALSIYATLDELTTLHDIAGTRALLPADTSYVEIPGGDHWNFGHFGPERRTAAISREAQQAQIIEATLAFLRRVAPPPSGTAA